MFGIGGSEILVILVVALLFLGPDRLPDAAKQISKGIRDLRKQSRALQQTIEDDEHIGGAIRDLKSALRGEDPPVRYPPPVVPPASHEALASGDEAVAPTGEHPSDDFHGPASDPHALGHCDEIASDGDSDSGLALVKPPAGETAARNPPAENPDPASHKNG